jgi:hypothetical protein
MRSAMGLHDIPRRGRPTERVEDGDAARLLRVTAEDMTVAPQAVIDLDHGPGDRSLTEIERSSVVAGATAQHNKTRLDRLQIACVRVWPDPGKRSHEFAGGGARGGPSRAGAPRSPQAKPLSSDLPRRPAPASSRNL